VLGTQKAAVGGQLGDIAERNALDFNGGLVNRLASIVDDASQHLPADRVANIAGTVDRILAQVGQDGRMLGTNYQGWREPLRGLAADNQVGRYFRQIRSAMDEAFQGGLSGADAEAFRRLSGQYFNVKTISNAMGGAGRGTKTGDISPAQLEAALTQQVGREGKALGRGGPLNELVGVGRQFVSESIPDSGTAQRQFIQSLLTTGGGAGAGAGAGAVYAALTGGDLKQGAALGAGLTAGALFMPRLVQGVLGIEAMQRYLTRGLIALTPAERGAINAAATALAPPVGLLSTQQ
jgi:hypothetical protein